MRMGSVSADSPFRCFSPIGEDASFPKRACHHKCACFHAPCGDISDPVFPSSERCFSACCDDVSSSGSVLTDMVLPSVRPACPCGCAGCFRTACVEFAAYSRMGKIASPTAFCVGRINFATEFSAKFERGKPFSANHRMDSDCPARRCRRRLRRLHLPAEDGRRKDQPQRGNCQAPVRGCRPQGG